MECIICKEEKTKSSPFISLRNCSNQCNALYCVCCLKNWTETSNKYTCLICFENIHEEDMKIIKDTKNIENAIKSGDIELVKKLHAQGYRIKGEELVNASRNGHLSIVQFIISVNHDRSKRMLSSGEIDMFEICRFIGDYQLDIYERTWALEDACASGHIDVVKFLYSFNGECTDNAMNQACFNGHTDIVKFLHSIGKKCDIIAFEHAKVHNYNELTEFLLSVDGIKH